MTTPRPHAELIHAWANGAQIQFRRSPAHEWKDIDGPSWVASTFYRLKPTPRTLRYRVALRHDPTTGRIGTDAYNEFDCDLAGDGSDIDHFIRWLSPIETTTIEE